MQGLNLPCRSDCFTGSCPTPGPTHRAPHSASQAGSSCFFPSPCTRARSKNGGQRRRTPGRTRTCGTRFRKAVLYPLSYESMKQARKGSNLRPVALETTALPLSYGPLNDAGDQWANNDKHRGFLRGPLYLHHTASLRTPSRSLRQAGLAVMVALCLLRLSEPEP